MSDIQKGLVRLNKMLESRNTEIEQLETKLSNYQADLDEIKGVVGFPGTIALQKHGLSDRLPDVVRYCHREWLEQTHSSQQRYIKEQARADSLESRLEQGRNAWNDMCIAISNSDPSAKLDAEKRIIRALWIDPASAVEGNGPTHDETDPTMDPINWPENMR